MLSHLVKDRPFLNKDATIVNVWTILGTRIYSHYRDWQRITWRNGLSCASLYDVLGRVPRLDQLGVSQAHHTFHHYTPFQDRLISLAASTQASITLGSASSPEQPKQSLSSPGIVFNDRIQHLSKTSKKPRFCLNFKRTIQILELVNTYFWHWISVSSFFRRLVKKYVISSSIFHFDEGMLIDLCCVPRHDKPQS
jgi:hypothetical protein